MQPKLILASSSPSRKMVLNKLNIAYQAISPDIDEALLPNETVEKHVIRLAQEKALKVAEALSHDKSPMLLIGCDSVCLLDGQIVSKPEIHENAVKQLKASSGNVIFFYSGLVLYSTKSKNLQREVIRTEVHFKKLSDKLIESYLQAEKPYNCAGSIRAEGLGIILMDKIIADDPNSLVGLPLIALVNMLQNEGYAILC